MNDDLDQTIVERVCKRRLSKTAGAVVGEILRDRDLKQNELDMVMANEDQVADALGRAFAQVITDILSFPVEEMPRKVVPDLKTLQTRGVVH